MTLESMLAFAVAMAIFSATPGAGCFALIAHSISRGAPAAFLLLTGILLGDIVYIVAAALGLGVLAAQMGEVFYIVKLIGAAYLVYLGWKAWTDPIDIAPEELKELDQKSLWAGFLVSIGNPKVMIFYLAFLPTFVDLTAITTTDVLIVCLITIVITYIIEGSYIMVARKMSSRLRSYKARKAFNRVSGGLLMGAGTAIGLRS